MYVYYDVDQQFHLAQLPHHLMSKIHTISHTSPMKANITRTQSTSIFVQQKWNSVSAYHQKPSCIRSILYLYLTGHDQKQTINCFENDEYNNNGNWSYLLTIRAFRL